MKKLQINGLQTMVKIFVMVLPILSIQNKTWGQSAIDSTKQETTFSGSLGLTNNGFSIIPSFSFNKPAAIILLSWMKDKFSVDPDFRVTPDGQKGSMLLWFRCQPIRGKQFTLRTGIHPAINWIPIQLVENGIKQDFLQLRRFVAWELAPSFKVTEKFRLGIYYLQGNGLQSNSIRTTHFITLNSTISNIPITKKLNFTFIPVIYYLYLDGTDGKYFSATGILSHKKSPFTLQSSFNKTIKSNIPANKDFLWNVSVVYNFKMAMVNLNK